MLWAQGNHRWQRELGRISWQVKFRSPESVITLTFICFFPSYKPIAVCPLLYENHCTGQESSLSDAVGSGPEEMTVAKFFAFTVQLIREQFHLFIRHYRQRAGGTAVSERMQQRQDRNGEAAANAMRERGRHIVGPNGGGNLDVRRYHDLQVTVAIAMPRPKESNMKTKDRGSKVDEYSFGICQVQWKDSEQEI
jgi:hypothetical protein